MYDGTRKRPALEQVETQNLASLADIWRFNRLMLRIDEELDLRSMPGGRPSCRHFAGMRDQAQD